MDVKSIDKDYEKALNMTAGKIEFDLDNKLIIQTLVAISKCIAEPELSISFTVKDSAAGLLSRRKVPGVACRSSCRYGNRA